MAVRVRFAPSPSGDLHVGNARTALFNWLFARKEGGQFILRIEDTDRQRSTPEAIAAILDSLAWLGLDWDEGPGVGGPKGPYQQSLRLDSYRELGDRLLREGNAYWCYSSPEELEEERRQLLESGGRKRPHADRSLTAEQRGAREATGVKPSLRFAVPDLGGDLAFEDLVRGEIRVPMAEIGDFNLIKSDGTPMYNFAAVVDDHGMGITHVLRGEDGISNTPRQLLLYRALGWEPPRFGHMSFILGPDHGKLSKSHGDTSIGDFKARGYLPEALVNYLVLLGLGGHGEGSEVLDRERMKGMFSVEAMVKNPAIFDYGKLQFLNAHYLREMPPARLLETARPFLRAAGVEAEEGWLGRALDLAKGQAVLLADLPRELDFFFREPEPAAGEAAAVLAGEAGRKALAGLVKTLASSPFPRDADEAKAFFKRAQAEAQVKGKDFFMPVRLALTGREHGPELVRLLPLMKPEDCARRARKHLEA